MRIVAAFDTAEHGQITAKGRATPGVGGYTSAVVTAGSYCFESMASISGASTYTDFATVLETAFTSVMGSAVTATWDGDALTWTLSKTGASDWDVGADDGDAGVARLGRFLGFSTAQNNTDTAVSDVRPYFVLEPAMGELAKVSDDYQPDNIWTEAEASDGSSYAVGRVSAPTYSDFRVVMETYEATFQRAATAAVPYAFQQFIEDVGAAHPFWVVNNGESTVHRMRAKAATFEPVREVSDWDGAWHWPFETRVIGRS